MNNPKPDKENTPHAPGTGSDRHHPETPADANERFKNKAPENIQEKPGSQHSG